MREALIQGPRRALTHRRAPLGMRERSLPWAPLEVDADELTRAVRSFGSFAELCARTDYVPTLALDPDDDFEGCLARLYDAEMERSGSTRRAWRGSAVRRG